MIFHACSKHGILDSKTGKCICSTGFSSLADFNLIEGINCDQNAVVIKVLAIFCSIFAAWALTFHLRVLSLKLSRGRGFPDSVVLCATTFSFYSIFTLSFGIFKSLNPFGTIGISVIGTIFGCSEVFFLLIGCAYVVAIIRQFFKAQAIVANFDGKNTERIDYMFKIHHHGFFLTLLISLIGSYWPLVILIQPRLFPTMVIFASSVCVVMAINAVVFLSGLRRMMLTLFARIQFIGSDEGDNITHQSVVALHATFRQLYDKLSFSFNMSKIVCPSVVVVLLCFSFWPLANRMISYGFLILLCLASYCSVVWVRMFAPAETIPVELVSALWNHIVNYCWKREDATDTFVPPAEDLEYNIPTPESPSDLSVDRSRVVTIPNFQESRGRNKIGYERYKPGHSDCIKLESVGDFDQTFS